VNALNELVRLGNHGLGIISQKLNAAVPDGAIVFWVVAYAMMNSHTGVRVNIESVRPKRNLRVVEMVCVFPWLTLGGTKNTGKSLL